MEGNKLVPRKYLFIFCLITTLFALWGFANDITNPMVAAFQTLMEISAAKASLIQFAFYGGYATMAIPAALLIRRYSYKTGILTGLLLYAIGAFMFIPAATYQQFSWFCLSLYVLTFGLAFLETSANPFILSLGPRETATRRLNLAQAFNPLGSLCGMSVASMYVLPALISDRRNAAGEIIFSSLPAAQKAAIRVHDLDMIRNPYVMIGCVVLVLFVAISLVKIPSLGRAEKNVPDARVKDTMKRLVHNKPYREGVVAQMFYIAAQIMVWTFIIQYADRLGINKADAQNYNIIAMLLFLTGRFTSTFLMKYVNAHKLLLTFACLAGLCTVGTILLTDIRGLYCLIGISAFMSLMFPTIYGISLNTVRPEDTSIGAAFLVMAIVGGAIMPPLQGMIIDLGNVCGMPAVNFSYVLPLVCFVIVGIYAARSDRMDRVGARQGRV